VPVVKDGELDRDDIATAALYPLSDLLDFFAEI
jgi:hypothetical protein